MADCSGLPAGPRFLAPATTTHCFQFEGEQRTVTLVQPTASLFSSRKRAEAGKRSTSKKYAPRVFTSWYLTRIQSQLQVLDDYQNGRVPAPHVLRTATQVYQGQQPGQQMRPDSPSGDQSQEFVAPDGVNFHQLPWMDALVGIATLPANNGGAIRTKVKEAIEAAEGHPLVQRQLKLATATNVYRCNSAGPSKQAALHVLWLHNPPLHAMVLLHAQATLRASADRPQAATAQPDDAGTSHPLGPDHGHSLSVKEEELARHLPHPPPDASQWPRGAPAGRQSPHGPSAGSSSPRLPLCGWAPVGEQAMLPMGEATSSTAKQLCELQQDAVEEAHFYDSLDAFLTTTKGARLDAGPYKVPVVAKRRLNLYKLYCAVCERGGMDAVTAAKAWRAVATAFDVPPSLTSASTTLKLYYGKFLADYERATFMPPVEPPPLLMQKQKRRSAKRKKPPVLATCLPQGLEDQDLGLHQQQQLACLGGSSSSMEAAAMLEQALEHAGVLAAQPHSHHLALQQDDSNGQLPEYTEMALWETGSCGQSGSGLLGDCAHLLSRSQAGEAQAPLCMPGSSWDGSSLPTGPRVNSLNHAHLPVTPVCDGPLPHSLKQPTPPEHLLGRVQLLLPDDQVAIDVDMAGLMHLAAASQPAGSLHHPAGLGPEDGSQRLGFSPFARQPWEGALLGLQGGPGHAAGLQGLPPAHGQPSAVTMDDPMRQASVPGPAPSDVGPAGGSSCISQGSMKLSLHLAGFRGSPALHRLGAAVQRLAGSEEQGAPPGSAGEWSSLQEPRSRCMGTRHPSMDAPPAQRTGLASPGRPGSRNSKRARWQLPQPLQQPLPDAGASSSHHDGAAAADEQQHIMNCMRAVLGLDLHRERGQPTGRQPCSAGLLHRQESQQAQHGDWGLASPQGPPDHPVYGLDAAAGNGWGHGPAPRLPPRSVQAGYGPTGDAGVLELLGHAGAGQLDLSGVQQLLEYDWRGRNGGGMPILPPEISEGLSQLLLAPDSSAMPRMDGLGATSHHTLAAATRASAAAAAAAYGGGWGLGAQRLQQRDGLLGGMHGSMQGSMQGLEAGIGLDGGLWWAEGTAAQHDAAALFRNQGHWAAAPQESGASLPSLSPSLWGCTAVGGPVSADSAGQYHHDQHAVQLPGDGGVRDWGPP